MAKSLVTDSGTLFLPGAVAQFKVESNPSGLATTGILMLVGEADAGPHHSAETDLEQNAFGPDQMSDVASKYKSGPLVDAFRSAISAANDPDITGSFQACILVKTNVSAKASANLPKIGGGTYGVLADKNYGKAGNQITYQTTQATAETLPTTGAFTFIPNAGSLDYRIRVDGGAAVGTSLGANTSPTVAVSTLNALAGVAASGGANRNIITAFAARTLALDAFPPSTTATTVIVTQSVAWDNLPSVGDTMVIPTGSVIAGAATDPNVGAYVITAVTATTVTAVKLSDAGKTVGGAAVPGVITNPVDVSAVAEAAVTDCQAFSPVTISQDPGAIIDGVGKSLEIAELTSGADLLSRTAFVLGTTGPVTWISKTTGAQLLSSASEYSVNLNAGLASAFVSEVLTAGGEVALKLSYTGTTATVTITDTTLTTTVTGGAGTNLSLSLADFPSLQALADFIASQPGYSCGVGTAALGQLPSAALDNVTGQGICSQFGAQNGRLKIDAYRLFNTISSDSVLVQLGVPATQAGAGLPDVMTAQQFLTGGTRGGTSDAQVTAAISALEDVRGNFLVPLFSRNATLDIADGLTEAGQSNPTVAASSYTVSAVHALAKSHVLAMSTLKRRRNRQALLSIADTFANSKQVAANIASFRCTMAFEDFKQPGSTGSITQFLPWMGSVLAASMQAAGFYRNIEFKGINTSGVLSRAGDFNPKSDSHVTQALQAGLMPARASLTGGFIFASDQTTYGKDNNFVFNSLQAVYAADTVALTMAQRMETAFVGQSVADVSAPVARAFAETVLADMLRLKLIAPSDDDAPKGWKNLLIRIIGNAMLVSVEIKLATAIDFIKIDFLVSQVQQSA